MSCRCAEFNARMFEYYNRISLCQCPHCGRSFNEEAFARHATMCTAETPGGPHAKRAPGASSGMGSGPSRMAASTGAGAHSCRTLTQGLDCALGHVWKLGLALQ